ncbi:hypothetical protein [Nostoc sp. LPT]|uniref:hypothetical protein n=1 Tax=Nostoc sp. LPT TaxID=2815387 RepID=UPI001D1C494B|nr:hypothetical protein [Nostoc sp. LPT]MBN4002532.1 hypothetical protein [Nostoc sp. LPT]
MNDRTFGHKKAGKSTFSNPSLVSPTTSTLANPVRGFGLPTNNHIQTEASESTNLQEAQAADEQSLLSKAIQQRSFGHDISRISLRDPQVKLAVGEPNDQYEQQADSMANQVMWNPPSAQPVHRLSQFSQTKEQNLRISRSPGDSGGKSTDTQTKESVTWLDLPHAHLKKGAKKGAKKGKLTLTSVENTPNADPTLTYASEEDVDLTSKNSEEIDDSRKNQIIAEIVVARNAIPAREIGRSPYGEAVGNFHDPARAKDDPIAAQYNQWSQGAQPTQKFDPSNPEDQKKWQIFKKTIPLEGRLATITTFDKTLTIGVGFSSSGRQAEQIIAQSFDALPEVKNLAFQAGLIADKKTKSFLVVDTEKAWILDGTDASNYIQTNHALLSLIINVSQGRQTNQSGQEPSEDESVKQRQTMLDAQWTTFLENAINGIPPEILEYPLDSATLAVQSRHAISATFPWSFWQENNNPDLKAMVGAIYKKLKQINQLYWLYPICGGIYKPYADEVVAKEEASDFYKKLNGLQMSDMLKELRRLAAQKKLKIRLDLYDGSYGGRLRVAMLAVLNLNSTNEQKLSIISTTDFAELPPDQQQMIRQELGLN